MHQYIYWKLPDMAIRFHEYWTLHEGVKYHFLCPLCGAREHSQIIHYLAVYQVKTAQCKFDVNRMTFVT